MITLAGYSTCVDFLRVFGTRISQIVIDYTAIDQLKYNDMQTLVHEYCGGTYPNHGGSLVSIEFYSPQKFPIDEDVNFGPFENIEDVYLSFSGLE